MSHTVLLVDDESHVLSGLTRLLHKESYEIMTAASAEEAAAILATRSVDLIVCDEQMPGISGTQFLASVAEEYPEVVRIVLTGHPSVPAVLRAINEGKVYHFFTKPCNEIDLAITIRRGLEQKDLRQKTRDLLEVTKRQSALIEEARVLRRLQDAPRPLREKAIAKGEGPAPPKELLQEIDDEVRRGRELLACVGPRSGARAEPQTVDIGGGL
jgi:two-component system probable response regulator PhcQ